MKVYTEVVWSWDEEKGELVEESSKSHEYEGPVVQAYNLGKMWQENVEKPWKRAVKESQEGKTPLSGGLKGLGMGGDVLNVVGGAMGFFLAPENGYICLLNTSPRPRDKRQWGKPA